MTVCLPNQFTVGDRQCMLSGHNHRGDNLDDCQPGGGRLTRVVAAIVVAIVVAPASIGVCMQGPTHSALPCGTHSLLPQQLAGLLEA